MEFRVFFPVLSLKDIRWLSESAIQAYTNALNELDLPTSVGSEVRSDQYFITPPFMGLKFRHGENLEMKVRDYSALGIERWTKAKFGKENPQYYHREISRMLSHFGHNVDISELAFERQIELQKTRRNAYITNQLAYEACHVTPTPGTVSSLHYPTKKFDDREWFSIAVEGNHATIKSYISSPNDSARLRSSIRCIRDVLAPVLQEAASNGCVPVVSGYPLFVRHITGTASEEEVLCDVLGGWEALLAQLEL